MPDPRITEWTFDVEADRRAAAKLADVGIEKPADLLTGRIDVTRAAQILKDQNINDATVNPMIVEKAMRDAEYLKQAGIQEEVVGTPGQPIEAATPTPALADLQRELERQKQETEHWRDVVAKQRDERGDLKRRLRQIEENQAVQSRNYAPQPQYNPYDPRMVGGMAPQEPVTAGQMQASLAALTQALGSYITQSQEDIIQRAKSLGRYDLSLDEEEDLMDAHPWIKRLPAGDREQAMLSLARPAPGASRPPGPQPATRLTPQRTAPEEILRARLREAAYVEPSNRTNKEEAAAAAPAEADDAKKLAALREALAKPGGSDEAEKIMASLGAGRVDDRPGTGGLVGLRRLG